MYGKKDEEFNFEEQDPDWQEQKPEKEPKIPSIVGEDGKKIFSCDLCNEKSYSKKSDLKRHIATAHEGSEPYTCEICGKSFATRKSDLKR